VSLSAAVGLEAQNRAYLFLNFDHAAAESIQGEDRFLLGRSMQVACHRRGRCSK